MAILIESVRIIALALGLLGLPGRQSVARGRGSANILILILCRTWRIQEFLTWFMSWEEYTGHLWKSS